ncbi:hypothetical protein AB6A40_006290 [Gnathostoma spinigerum]|uniref:Uncharacterized protein n=1 Tax=Gnathostoma spinigerum TaxID=75299 RepID=A0ABD6EIM3_9BILA
MDSKEVSGGTPSTSNQSTSRRRSPSINKRYFGEESDIPYDRLRPTQPPPPYEFLLERCDEMVDPLPPPQESTMITIYYDPVVLHTVALMQYFRMLNQPDMSADRIGPVPEESLHKPTLSLIQQHMSQQLSSETVHTILLKGIAFLAAQIGFDEVDLSILNVLTRIVSDKICTMWNNLKTSHERRLEKRETAFPSAVMHALRLEKINNIMELRDFYDQRFRKRRNNILTICENGREELLKPTDRRMGRKRRAPYNDEIDCRSPCTSASDVHNIDIFDDVDSGEINFLEP